MRSLIIFQDSESFDIRDFTYEVTLAEIKGWPLLWDKAGELRKIPMAVIRNTLDVLTDYRKMQRQGRIQRAPAAAWTITWDQTEPNLAESAGPEQAE